MVIRKVISPLAALVALSFVALPAALWAQTAAPTLATRTTPDVRLRKDTLRLVVNVVVSGLPYDWLARFEENLSDEGFARFAAEGTRFSAAHYNYMQTISPVGLATLTTGVNPSMHGIVSGAWMDYVTDGRISLVDDPAVQGLGCEPGTQRFSNSRIVMPTLGDKLLAENPQSKVVSVAAEPASAIVAGGLTGTAYWMDFTRAVWVSSTRYMERLPEWVEKYNNEHAANLHIPLGWSAGRPVKSYMNRVNTIFQGGSGERISTYAAGRGDQATNDYNALLHGPAGNTLVAEFAALAVQNDGLGADGDPDILNICFDASRYVGQKYGSASMEVEDMLYRLDFDLASMVRAIRLAVGRGDIEAGAREVLFSLTSDSGASDAWDAGRVKRDRFVANQFKTLLNSFLTVQFGSGNWVLDYIDRQLYLNHNLIYQHNLNLATVQNRAAAFALEFRGVSHVLTSTALSSGYFGAGYGLGMQNSFYPRRAGDLMINLMPGWIEERPDTKSLPGSMYDYDTHVPLIIFGAGVEAGEVTRPVDMTALAPTIAHLMGIGRPIASDGVVLPGIVRQSDGAKKR